VGAAPVAVEAVGEEPISLAQRNHIDDTELGSTPRQLAPIFVDTRQQLA
jgi:hypothetical protein